MYKIRPSSIKLGRWCSIAGPLQASSLSCPTWSQVYYVRIYCTEFSVRLSHSLFVTAKALVSAHLGNSKK